MKRFLRLMKWLEEQLDAMTAHKIKALETEDGSNDGDVSTEFASADKSNDMGEESAPRCSGCTCGLDDCALPCWGAAEEAPGLAFDSEDALEEAQQQVDYLTAVLGHHGIDPADTGRMLYDANGVAVWVPNPEQEEAEAAPKRPPAPARQPTPRTADSGGAVARGSVKTMTHEQRLEWGKRMDAADNAGRPIA